MFKYKEKHTVCMPPKPNGGYRLTPAGFTVCQKYPGKSVSEVLVTMDEELQRHAIGIQQAIGVKHTESILPPDFWTHLEAVVRKAMNTPKPTLNPFQTGTAIKQFGKIDEDETLVEGRKKGEKCQ